MWKENKEQIGQNMNAQDAIFEDLQTLSDEAEELGLADVALVLEFAMDVFLKETQQTDAPDIKTDPVPLGGPDASKDTHAGWSISSFPLAQIYQKAS